MNARATQAGRLQRLTQVSRAFTYATSLTEILRLTADQAAELLGTDKAILMLTDADGLFHVRASAGISPERAERLTGTLDESTIGGLQRLLGADSLERFIGVPLVVQGRVTGLLAVLRPAERPATPDDEWLLSALADQTAAPLENARLAEEAERAALLAENARLYEAERAARRDAENANQSKSQFLATMSHELRTPLNAIAGYVDLIDMEVYGPVIDAQREALQRIRRNERYLLGLINDVLDFAKLEAGRVQCTVCDVPMDETLLDMEALIAPQVRAKTLRYRFDRCDPALTARADREKLQQVVLNLLSNAIKFTPPQGEIVLTCTADDADVIIQVRDTGSGIPAPKLEQIFDPFVRLDHDLSSATEGTGLGLAISRNLARLMHGDLTATSTLGCGSVFTVRLPRATA
ncbi:MAG TPA: GAF domain-containing sensor histidine kinase [Gemmatimonadaceae bacterium]|nr:GAF domain-containing sensor histidine kinase [Gemmatimonadaceae bacterium]